MERLRADLAKAAQVEADVLITGETGTGKQLVAEAIHRHSRRAGQPFICINCGALDENLLLDTLFGHVKGAFTEARSDRKGAFLEAEGGLLFLDEIQTATPKVQQALLRAIAMARLEGLLTELTALRAQCQGQSPVAHCGILRGLANRRETETAPGGTGCGRLDDSQSLHHGHPGSDT